MSIRVRTYQSIEDAGPRRWDALVSRCGAPLFYRSTFLRAFEQFPLHDVHRRFYIAGEDEHGALVFASPLYVLKNVDPMGILRTHFADYCDKTVLVNHVWHCYDTWILAERLDRDVVATMLASMADLAADQGAALWGFTNVDGRGALSRALDAQGLAGVEVEQRFVADLTATSGLDGYLATLEQRVRSNLKRYARIAERVGLIARIVDVEHADLEGFIDLARTGAAKYNNADYYRPGVFDGFLRALGGHARVLEQRLDGKLIAAAVLLIDDSTLHWWVCGNDYRAVPQISPFYLGFLGAVGEALRDGKPNLEAGRRNPGFKTRHGLLPRPVHAHFMPTAIAATPSSRSH